MSKGKMLGEGRTAEVYLCNSDKILKLFREWVPKEWIQYEDMIAQAVFAAGVPAPEPFESIQLDGRSGLVYEKINGKSLLKLMNTKPWNISGYAKQMAQLHFQIHQSSSSTEKIPTMKEKMAYAIKKAEPILGEKTEQIITYMNSLPSGNNICHGDFHPDNILVSDKLWVAIDWMGAYVGNPLSDVARSSLMLHAPSITPGIPKSVVKILKDKIYSSYIKEYKKLAHVKWEDVESWMLPVAAARIWEEIPGEKKWLLSMIDNKLNQIENLP